MATRRNRHRLLAGLVAACVLFAHTAASAYDCVRLAAGGERPAAVEVTPCPSHAEQGSSEDVLAGDANVCKVHCQDTTLPDAPAPLAMPAAMSSHPASASASATVTGLLLPPEPRGAAPPPALKHARLLI